MKTTYIYLNEYPNGYLYVGSHTWDGPLGVVDPTYLGTSYVAKRYGWQPCSTTILEETVKFRDKRERYWIERYAAVYGIADCARLLSPKNELWISKYARYGRLINCHANDASQCHNPESFRKSFETRLKNGDIERSIRAAEAASHSPEVRAKAISTMRSSGTLSKVIGAMHKVAHSPEVARRQLESRKRNGTIFISIAAAHSPEAMKKAQETRLLNGAKQRSIEAAATPESRAKANATRRKNARKVQCIETGFVGCTPELAEYLGCTVSKASNLISKCKRDGMLSYNGMYFKYIEK